MFFQVAGSGAMSRLAIDRSERYEVSMSSSVLSRMCFFLQFLAPRLSLVVKNEASRLWAHQLQLTIADWLHETHDTHHPIANALYYEEQAAEAKKRAAHFISKRLPKFLDYFEKILKRNVKDRDFIFGKKISYIDLSLF